MNTTIKAKPTPKLQRYITIVQSKYDTPCLFCKAKTVRIGIVPSTNGDSFEVRHLCTRHKGFGLWYGYDAVWGDE